MENKSFEATVLLDAIKSLRKEIQEIKKEHTCTFPNRSAEIHELVTALAKAQAEYAMVSANKENPYFKSRYADYTEHVKATRPALTKYGLSVDQALVNNDDGQIVLVTTLSHASGQWKESRLKVIPPKNDIQSFGSHLAYLKRHTYSSLVGSVVDTDDDDDGEKSVATQREVYAKGVAINTKYNPRENSGETITKEQLEELEYELGDYDDITEQVLDGLKIQNLADMPKDKFLISVKRIREIKNAREGKK